MKCPTAISGYYIFSLVTLLLHKSLHFIHIHITVLFYRITFFKLCVLNKDAKFKNKQQKLWLYYFRNSYLKQRICFVGHGREFNVRCAL